MLTFLIFLAMDNVLYSSYTPCFLSYLFPMTQRLSSPYKSRCFRTRDSPSASQHTMLFLDGKTSSMFIKNWAQICRQQQQNLPENNLTPFYDRSLIKDQTELDEKLIRLVRSPKGDDKTNIRSLTPYHARELGDDVVLATLVLSRDDVERLKNRVKHVSPGLLHLSTFVIAYAYTWTCFVKARGGNGERSVSFLFVGDFRERLDPPLPSNYFGNCVIPVGCYNRKAVEFMEEKGFVTAVEILSDLVKGMDSRKVETLAESLAEAISVIMKLISGGEDPLRLILSLLTKERRSQWRRDVMNQVVWRLECA